MRKILILLFSFIATTLLASEIRWAKDYHSGISMAKIKNKPVLFVVSSRSCKYCTILKNTTFKDKNVIETLNRDYVAIISYSDAGDYIPPELRTPGVPALWFLFPTTMTSFEPMMGAIAPKDFLYALDIVKKEFDKSNK